MLSDVVVPTGLPSFITPKLIFTSIACLIVAYFFVRLWRAIPKSLLIPLALIGGLAIGVISIKLNRH